MLPPSGDPWATQLIPADAADHAQRQAEGKVALSAPRLCGQHFGYILRRVGEVIARRRADSDAAMSAISAALPADDLAAIADYLSRDTCAPATAEPSQ